MSDVPGLINVKIGSFFKLIPVIQDPANKFHNNINNSNFLGDAKKSYL